MSDRVFVCDKLSVHFVASQCLVHVIESELTQVDLLMPRERTMSSGYR